MAISDRLQGDSHGWTEVLPPLRDGILGNLIMASTNALGEDYGSLIMAYGTIIRVAIVGKDYAKKVKISNAII